MHKNTLYVKKVSFEGSQLISWDGQLLSQGSQLLSQDNQ